jgi:hypothetical protein
MSIAWTVEKPEFSKKSVRKAQVAPLPGREVRIIIVIVLITMLYENNCRLPSGFSTLFSGLEPGFLAGKLNRSPIKKNF